MRPVSKGVAPQAYRHWRDARNDLANHIGWNCSYCEMAVSNMIEVEHIVPIDRGGQPLDWNNFLLSCRYCNAVKSNHNLSRTGYVWPDRDNTDLTFRYTELYVIQAIANGVHDEAEQTINLLGLSRQPGGIEEPTEADMRWIFRMQAWLIAKRSKRNWIANPSHEMADQIALTALGTGFYSIWITVFAGNPQVINAINAQFPNTYNDVDVHGNRILRIAGII